MKPTSFDYQLPKELIAQKLKKPRDHSRLMILDRKNKKIKHDFFYNLPSYLTEKDVLVFNNSKVLPARLWFNKQTGGEIEVLLLKNLKGSKCEALLGGKGRKENLKLYLKSKLICRVIKKFNDGRWIIKFNLTGKKFKKFLEKYGQAPTPPYIKLKRNQNLVKKDYQTIYAQKEGSVAAPTAGLHFTPDLFKKLAQKNIKHHFITLHVGYGTFQPIKEEKIEKHKMHLEYAEINKKTAQNLNQALKNKKRIIAVGTTSARILETAFKKQKITTFKGWIDLFIYPGYKFKIVKGLITNFHLPKSTLLMLVSAFAGRKFILKAYQKAIKKKYRFYSFGDGMLIL